MLVNFIIGMVLNIIVYSVAFGSMATYGLSYQYLDDPWMMFGMLGSTAGLSVVVSIWSIINIIPGLSIVIRRLHDIGKGWPWIFISLIPFVGGIILIVFMATASKFPPYNQFGILRQV